MGKERFRLEFLKLEALHSLSRLEVSEAIKMAGRALSSGLETEALLEMAGEDEKQSFSEFEDLWKRLKGDLKIPNLEPWQGIHILVVPAAKDLVKLYLDGDMSWVSAATALVDLADEWGRPPFLDELEGACASYYYWEDQGAQSEEFFNNLENEVRPKFLEIDKIPFFEEGGSFGKLKKVLSPCT